MESQALLEINDQSITVFQALAYLANIGEDQSFILKILRQHLIEEELKTRNNVAVDPTHIEQAIVQLRIQNKLISSEYFETWLKEKNMSYDSLRKQIVTRLKVEKLMQKVTESKIETYFETNHKKLEKVALSRIVVASQEEAEKLKIQILEDNNHFGELAQKYSLTDDRYVNGVMPPLLIIQLPENTQETVLVTTPGTTIGPFSVEGGYCLLRVEQFIPATLDNLLKQQIRNQIFDQWLAEKLAQCEVRLHIS